VRALFDRNVMQEPRRMNKLFRVFLFFLLGTSVVLPLGIVLTERLITGKEKANGMLAEEDFADVFAKTQFTHADPQRAREALLYAVKIHRDMQIANPKYRGWPETFDWGWCYAELSLLDESAGNEDLAKAEMLQANERLKEAGAKDSTISHLLDVARSTPAKVSSNSPVNGKPR
jgi:hypothetical protein